jgi:hypothetical protein
MHQLHIISRRNYNSNFRSDVDGHETLQTCCISYDYLFGCHGRMLGSFIINLSHSGA